MLMNNKQFAACPDGTFQGKQDEARDPGQKKDRPPGGGGGVGGANAAAILSIHRRSVHLRFACYKRLHS